MSKTHEKGKKRQKGSQHIGTMISWILGILFCIVSLFILTSSIPLGLLSLLCALLIMPFFSNLIHSKLNFEITWWMKILLIILILIFVGIVANKNKNPATQINDSINVTKAFEPKVKATQTNGSINVSKTPELKVEKCVPQIECTNWSKCSFDRKQTRICSDVRNCSNTSNQQEESQTCEFTEQQVREYAIKPTYDDFFSIARVAQEPLRG